MFDFGTHQHIWGTRGGRGPNWIPSPSDSLARSIGRSSLAAIGVGVPEPYSHRFSSDVPISEVVTSLVHHPLAITNEVT
ncbi:hypothetical protein OPV22_009421 [Ensete ventricosum]|uniref:Uncharacterized protein n=1 Tax=Ensete ventricosum TaxID=4639 RepID=A0AAV8RGX6_ENSVE|nr:hypothetical protein OPV22_009421 [Ensete ventricosum]